MFLARMVDQRRYCFHPLFIAFAAHAVYCFRNYNLQLRLISAPSAMVAIKHVVKKRSVIEEGEGFLCPNILSSVEFTVIEVQG